MKYDNLYYLIYESGDQPMIDGDFDINGEHGMEEWAFESLDTIKIEHPVHFLTPEPLSDDLTYYDYLSTPDPIFSQKIIEALTHLPLQHNLQLLKTIIRDEEVTNEYHDFVFAHCLTEIKCMHHQRSEFQYDRSMDIYEVEKLSLDERILDKIKEENRLAFRLEESGEYMLYHQKVIDAIMSVNPEGLQAVSVASWEIGAMFDD